MKNSFQEIYVGRSNLGSEEAVLLKSNPRRQIPRHVGPESDLDFREVLDDQIQFWKVLSKEDRIMAAGASNLSTRKPLAMRYLASR
jgi:hypothetical protein